MIGAALVAAVPLAIFGGGRPLAPARPEKKIDAGVFAITVAGRRAGREAFEIVETGNSLEVRTRATIALPAGPTTIRGTLRADLDWKPRGGTLDTTTRGRTVRVTLHRDGERRRGRDRAALARLDLLRRARRPSRISTSAPT